MKGIVITSRGIEGTASIEISELINAKCEIENGCVIFEVKSLRDLCVLCYRCQSADRVVCLIGSFEFKNFFDEFEKYIINSDFSSWFEEINAVKVECIRHGTHNFKSVDVEIKTGEIIAKKLRGRNIKIAMSNYEIIFLVYIVDDKCYFGIDFAGFEMNKRGYKIFLHPNSLRGTIAYSLVRESGFRKKDVMLDPFSRDGIIPIEAAFYANDFPQNYYKKDRFAFLQLKIGIDFEKFFNNIDKKIKKLEARIYGYDHLFKFVDYSKKNAKIAGVDKCINFSRVELEWLDIKFKEGSIDKIITTLPSPKNANSDKIYNEFFYQSNYILKSEGTIALISRIPDFVKKFAEKHNFILSKEKEVWSGEQLLKMLIFKKKDI